MLNGWRRDDALLLRSLALVLITSSSVFVPSCCVLLFRSLSGLPVVTCEGSDHSRPFASLRICIMIAAISVLNFCSLGSGTEALLKGGFLWEQGFDEALDPGEERLTYAFLPCCFGF